MSSHGRAPGGMIVIDGRKPVKIVVAKITTSADADDELGQRGEDAASISELATSNVRSRCSAA